MKILGIRIGHDAGAAIIENGKVLADISEERLTRIKNDGSFPLAAIDYCLRYSGFKSEELDCIALPNTDVPDVLSVFFDIPAGALPKVQKSPTQQVKAGLRQAMGINGSGKPVLPFYQKAWKLSERCRIELCPHHLAHAASAYFTSGLNEAKTLIATLDGVGDGVSVAIWRGDKNSIEPLVQYDGRGSLGWFYGNVTEGLEWRHGSDEWKVMGLSPYGKCSVGAFKGFHPEYRDGKLVRGHDYGEFGRWNDHGANHYHGRDAAALSSIAARLGREDYAAEAQRVVEEQAMELIIPWLHKEGVRNLCCAGGFFLNVKFNQKLWYSSELDTQWIYPNPGDAGLAVGAALYAWFAGHPERTHKRLQHIYWGPEYSEDEIKAILDSRGLKYQHVENPGRVAAQYLAKNCVVAWFQGRMESGPRALGNRSILMSPMRAENKDVVNAKIKYREAFRPFCPSMLHEKRNDYLVSPRDEHFMVSSFVATDQAKASMPAVVHVDGTARPQMVKRDVNPRYYNLIEEFGNITGVYGVLNTSFNVKGEPIVCHPREAIKCFFDTGLDVLVLGNFVLTKPTLEDLAE